MGGARIDVMAGERLLGTAVLSRDRRTVSVALTQVRPGDPGVPWGDVQVVAAGRRLDAPVADHGSGPEVPAGAADLPALDPLIASDPGRIGPYRTRTGEYTLAPLQVPGLPEPVEVRGVVVAPVGAAGRRPLVLLLHGRHTTCYSTDGGSSGDWPCPSGWLPVPSHLGYLQTQRLLASQGYLTVSIAANGINGQDWQLADGGAQARSVLVRHHLFEWSRWSRTTAALASAPDAVRRGPLADLDRVLLVGHSRGGEGVNRAALDSTTGLRVPWTIRGVVHYGPTAFGQNPAPGVPAIVLLPACDGDVFDLQGQAYVDAARDAGPDPVLRSAVMVLGANHNYFNAEWTPGVAKAPAWDDWGDDRDPVCGARSGSTRLSATEQRNVGATYTAAAAAVLIAGDRSAMPLLDGTRARAASTGDARVLTHALGARRDAALVPTDRVGLATTGDVSARLCRTAEANQGPVERSPVDLRCVPDGGWGTMPHFLPLYGLPGEPSRRVVEVTWTGASGSAVVDLPRQVNLAGGRALAVRVAVEPGVRGTTFALRLTDAAGRSLDLPDSRVDGLPGRPASTRWYQGKYWAREVRVPLDASAVRASGIDLRSVTTMTLLPRSDSGRVWVLDAWRWEPGLSTAQPLRLPRLDVGRIEVVEGDTPHTVTVPLTITGPARGPGRVWVAVLDPQKAGAQRSYIADVPPGARRVDVEIPIDGDTRDDYDELQYVVAVKAITGLGIGDYVGGALVRDDDATPDITVTSVRDSVVEGTALLWRFTMSAPSDVFIGIPFVIVPPDISGRHELDTADLPPWWLRQHGGDPTLDPPLPLSTVKLWLDTYLEPGMTTVDLRVPTVADGRPEGPESLALQLLEGADVPGLPAGTTLVGTVRDE
jgi:dienelactone hydrolase